MMCPPWSPYWGPCSIWPCICMFYMFCVDHRMKSSVMVWSEIHHYKVIYNRIWHWNDINWNLSNGHLFQNNMQYQIESHSLMASSIFFYIIKSVFSYENVLFPANNSICRKKILVISSLRLHYRNESRKHLVAHSQGTASGISISYSDQSWCIICVRITSQNWWSQ